MGRLLIRGIDPEILERLKARAKRNERSLEAEDRKIQSEAELGPGAIREALELFTETRRENSGQSHR